jgi:hypothetical protein
VCPTNGLGTLAVNLACGARCMFSLLRKSQATCVSVD